MLGYVHETNTQSISTCAIMSTLIVASLFVGANVSGKTAKLEFESAQEDDIFGEGSEA